MSLHLDREFLVTGGERHLKWLYIGKDSTGQLSLEGKAAGILEEQRLSVFVDIVCGTGKLEHRTYVVMSLGRIGSFDNTTREVKKFVDTIKRTFRRYFKI